MISSSLATFVEEKISYARLTVCIFIIGCIGVGLQFFEPYEMFWVLFPIILIMFVSIVLILQFCLKELQRFKTECLEDEIKNNACLFPEKNSTMILIIYALMIIVYFVCLYRLQFVEINLMGLYILILGGGTFFLALISYEVCVRLTKTLKTIEENIAQISYNEKNPQGTSWLQYFFHLHEVLKKAALATSILFVLENSMLFIANYEKHIFPILPNDINLPELLPYLPIEWWVIWVYVFVAIVVVLPLMKKLQYKSLKKIVLHIQTNFTKNLTQNFTINALYDDPQKYCFLLNVIHNVQNSLTEIYLPRKSERLLSLCASLLTCCAHLLSFCMIFIPSDWFTV